MGDPSILLPVIVFIPFAAAAVALLVGRVTGRSTGWLMVAAAATSFSLSVYLLTQLPAAGPADHAQHAAPAPAHVEAVPYAPAPTGPGEHGDAAHGTPPPQADHQAPPAHAVSVYQYNWIESLNIDLRFRGDSFGLFFALVVAGIGTLVGLYSTFYIDPLPNGRVGRYYAALIAFMGAMLGVVLSDDLILLFVFWEITSITSFLLIGFWYDEDYARKGAMTALQVTALGGLAMFAGFLLIGQVTGTYTISELASSELLRERLLNSPLALAALLLVLAGAFTKSAQFPFHFWLPGAMVAPTPVSTYLHAATMVKAGIYLLGRMLPIFGGDPAWGPIITSIGLVTFALAAVQSMCETDLKAILARTTLAALGMITMVYGLGAADQDALQIWSHAAYKGCLFLVAGIVEHGTHTRDIRLLGGLRRHMPYTFWLCVLGALSMAGLPPFFGFLAKEALYAQMLHNPMLAANPVAQWSAIAMVVISNAFIFAVSFKLIIGVFLGAEGEKSHHAHEAGAGLLVSPAVLGFVALFFGLAYPLTQGLVNFFSSDPQAHVHVSLVPHEAGPLVLSLITTALGVVVYRGRAAVQQWDKVANFLPKAQQVWDRFIEGSTWVATTFSSNWQNGSLRWYFSGILVFSSVLVLWALGRADLSMKAALVKLDELPWYALALAALLGIASVAMARANNRLAAAIASTAVGFLTSLMFVVYRSPDILLTQILIETVSTIFVLLVLFFMPAWKPERSGPVSQLWTIAVSCLVGFAMFTMMLLGTSPAYHVADNLAGRYLAMALPEGGGHNAVNVIIVDFRALDTTGEITVLVVVGLCVYGLLRARRHSA